VTLTSKNGLLCDMVHWTIKDEGSRARPPRQLVLKEPVASYRGTAFSGPPTGFCPTASKCRVAAAAV
jgi:hypothetical protein